MTKRTYHFHTIWNGFRNSPDSPDKGENTTPRKLNQLQLFFVIILIGSLIIFVVTSTFLSGTDKSDSTHQTTSINRNHQYGNTSSYFSYAKKLKSLDLLINTTGCRVPNVDPFDNEVLLLMKQVLPEEDCRKNYYNWSYVEGENLHLNTQQMKMDDNDFASLSCCYRTLSRPNVSEKKALNEGGTDDFVIYSTCIHLDKPLTKLTHQMIMVQCYSWSWFGLWEKILYRGYHAVARTFNNTDEERRVREKVNFWKAQKETPPNILVVGLESTSRLNFRRYMIKTRAFLEANGALEMFGYMRVGENTFPNLIPLLTGYSDSDIVNFCWNRTEREYLDKCPFLWNQLDKTNYITSHAEDSPVFAIFNYRKSGFNKQPTDFFLRPVLSRLWALVATIFPYESHKRPYTNDEFITNYLESTLDFAMDNKSPIFSFSWSTTLTHTLFNNLQLADETYLNLFGRLKAKNVFDNTILVVMGDHGYRYDELRHTTVGYYEKNLPNMWIMLPEKIKKKHPEWVKNLEINKYHVSTPHAFYWAIQTVLEAYSIDYEPPQAVHYDLKGNPVERKFKSNFFKEIPEDINCESAGVPWEYCPCHIPESLEIGDPIVRQAVNQSINKINKDLIDDRCFQFSIGKIKTAVRIIRTERNLTSYILSFEAKPGEFLFETTVNFWSDNSSFPADIVVERISKIDKSTINCLNDANLELFCYCK